MININDIYTAQSYLDSIIVKIKRDNKDYTITVEMINDDGVLVPMLIDGNHSLQAAKIDNVIPTIEIVEGVHNCSLVEYVTQFGDLSNPVNIVTGFDLW
ncbi:MAG: hypothetical protein WC373_04920 [Smithella sp.]|jgi:hypothetical protein